MRKTKAWMEFPKSIIHPLEWRPGSPYIESEGQITCERWVLLT
jgi:hypothetical protein